MDPDSYYPLIEADDVYKENSDNIKRWFDTLNYDKGRRKRPYLKVDKIFTKIFSNGF